MDIINVIDRLDALLNTSPKVPATRSRLVDAEKVMEVVEQLRLAIPQDIRAAQEVIDKKDAIINQAQIDARHTREQAESEFKARLDDNDLMTAARHRAERLTDESESKAATLIQEAEAAANNSRAEADTYIVQALRNLDRELNNVLTTVRKGLDTIGATVQV